MIVVFTGFFMYFEPQQESFWAKLVRLGYRFSLEMKLYDPFIGITLLLGALCYLSLFMFIWHSVMII